MIKNGYTKDQSLTRRIEAILPNRSDPTANIKECIAARNEPANAPLVEHGLAAMSGITQAQPSRRA
jgi:hypothetical protein